MKRSRWRFTDTFGAWVCVLAWCCRVEALTLTVDYKSFTLNEKETQSLVLARATCIPTIASNPCTVSLSGMSPNFPCRGCFAVLPCGDDYCLRFLANQGQFDLFFANRYTIRLQGSEGSDSETSYVDVHIRPNSLPYFDPDTYPEMHVTKTLSNSGFVKVFAVDKEGDAFQFTMTTYPSVDTIKIDSSSGTITATGDLRSLCRPFVTALVYVSDNHHTDKAGPLAVTLEIDGPNDRPIINNLNTEVYVREDEIVGQSFLPLAVHDEVGDGLTYTVTAVPSSAENLFKIDRTGGVEVNSALDYETLVREVGGDTVTLSISVNDGFCESDLYYLDVKIVDINEPPVLFPVDHTVKSCEGLVDIDPKWTNFSDPDIGDVIRFTDIQPNVNGRFRIDKETGVVSTTIDYDLDVDELPSTVVSVVTLSDRQGETATATLTIRFEDCNDNAPTYRIPARQYMVRDCWAAGTVVGTVPATEDLDSSYRQNNIFSHSGSGPGAMATASGSIVITQQFAAGQTVTFPVYATDKGQVPKPLTSKAHWVSLYTLPCIEPVTVEPPVDDGDDGDDAVTNDVSFWDFDGPNLGWIIAALLLAIALLALLSYFLWRYWRRIRNCCKRRRPCCPKYRPEKHRRPITPTRRPTPPPEKPKPGFLFGWWKETYINNDYEMQPNRKALPEPSKGPELVDTNTYDDEPDPPPPTPPPKRANDCHIL